MRADRGFGSALKRAVFTSILIALALVYVAPSAAEAAFPGPNSKVLFIRDGDIYTVNADGSGETNLTRTYPAREYWASWSADGTKIAFVADNRFGFGSSDQELAVMNSDGTQPRLVLGATCSVDQPSWSPDGQKLAFASPCLGSSDRDIFTINIDGTGLTNLTRSYGFNSYEYDPAWSPDGQKIAISRGSRIWTMNPDGSGLTQLTSGSDPGRDFEPNWSPDGTRLVFRSNRNCPLYGACEETWDIYSVRSDGTDLVRLLDTPDWELEPIWSPDGTKILFSRCILDPGPYTCTFDARVMNIDGGGAQPVAANAYGQDWQAAGPPPPPVSDQPGKIAFASSKENGGEDGSEIYTMNPDGTKQRRITFNRFSDTDPAWSPDGSKIAFVSVRPENGNGADNYDVYLVNADGSGETRLTNDPAFDGYPTWSPDGTKIAFISRRPDPGRGLYVMGADGSAETRVHSSPDLDLAWSPGGDVIAFSDGDDIYTVRPDGTNLGNLTNTAGFREYQPDWSPDGRKIAYRNDYDNNGFIHQTIWMMNSDGTGRGYVTEGTGQRASDPTWSPDGSKIAFITYPQPGGVGYAQIHTVNRDGSGEVNLSNDGPDLAPDWQAIVVAGGYPRPKGATPVVVALVTAFKQCTSANSTHGAPLSSPSCNPPRYESSYVTPGTADANNRPPKMIGSVRLDAVVGNPATSSDEADVALTVNVTDIRRKTDLGDYTGELRTSLPLRITDRLGYGNGAVTTQAIAFAFTVPCTATSDTTVGATCAVSTSADSVVPGAVTEGKRAIWELGQVAVFDGGADGTASTTGDNTLFARQGIFVP
jgi:Tol biopolymer transport system component